MEWHKYTEISEVDKKKTERSKNEYFSLPFYSRLIIAITQQRNYRIFYRHGVRLINDKGETKEVWEK